MTKDLSYSDKAFGTRAIHAGQETDPIHGGVIGAICVSSTFAQDVPGICRAEYDYSRAGNPSRQAFEHCIASLEKCKYGYAFSSGMAATSTVFQLLKKDDHVLIGDDVYGGTRRFVSQIINGLYLECDFINTLEEDCIEKHIKPNTKMIWIENPTNPLLCVSDVELLAKKAHEKGLIVVVDNTFMSPYFSNPINLGADIVMHSISKYINGHSDVIGGVLCCDDKELAERINFLQLSVGAILSPFDSFMVLRGVKTLHVRMQAHEKNALAVARHLEASEYIEKVLFLGLPSHPQHQLAKKQMSGFGGMISFYIKGGKDASIKFAQTVKIATLAESLGGVESLIEIPSIMTHASVPADVRDKLGISDNLIRLSVGIEDVEDLINDMDSALAAICDVKK